MRNRKESKKLKERIVKLYQEGISQNKLSQRLRISRTYVYLVLKEKNLI